MTKIAVVLDFEGIVAKSFESQKEKIPVIKTVEIIIALYDRADVFISSRSSLCHNINEFLEENNLDLFPSLIYGIEDGPIEEHLDRIYNYGEYDKIIYISNMPENFDFTRRENVIRIAVNAPHDSDIFPDDVSVFREPLAMEFLEHFI